MGTLYNERDTKRGLASVPIKWCFVLTCTHSFLYLTNHYLKEVGSFSWATKIYPYELVSCLFIIVLSVSFFGTHSFLHPQSLLPINKDTLKLGSNDGGVSFRNQDEKLTAWTNQICQSMNLAMHSKWFIIMFEQATSLIGVNVDSHFLIIEKQKGYCCYTP